MKKFRLFWFLFFTLFIIHYSLFTGSVYASFATVTKDGEVVWNVLASSNIEVKNTAIATDTSSLFLRSESGKFYLNDIDVTSLENQSLVDIEERPNIKKVVIGVKGDNFTLSEGGIMAMTNFPIKVDAKERELSVKTSLGETFLQILPKEAVDVAVRSRFITKSTEALFISDYEDEVVYKVSGEKVFDLLGVVSYSVPVTAYVSVSNGRIVNIVGPEWFKVFGFLFA
ncbi:MAG: hypothetical protein AAB656_02510 [Patescibacteria group bacterium]